MNVSRETPAIPDRWGFAVQGLTAYHDQLAGAGLERGLIGPREVDRLWERHILNSAALEELIPHGVTVVDVGSGAGLPGIPVALVRPDLRVVLLEPLLRRTTFLSETVNLLGLGDRVTVVRGRVEDGVVSPAEVVTARAVAPLDRLITWCWPLVKGGGQLVALKGEKAQQEIEEAASTLRKLGLTTRIESVGNTAAVIVAKG